MMDPYLPLDSKTGYAAHDGDDLAYLLDDAIFPTQVPSYDNA
jgi:hypothetical protein